MKKQNTGSEISVTKKKPGIVIEKVKRKDKRDDPSSTGNARCN